MRRTSSYPSDLTDGQWQVIAPHLPADQPGRRGRPRIWPLRVIVEAILYLDRTGCAWRYLPADRAQRVLALQPGDELRVAIETNNPATGIAVQLQTDEVAGEIGRAHV